MNSSSNGNSNHLDNGNTPDSTGNSKQVSNAAAKQEAIRILIVDDQQMIREGLKALIKTEDDLEIVGVAENGEHAFKQVEALKPNVVLMDMEMPGMNGMEATKLICQKFPNVKVLVLSTYDTQEYVSKSLNSGAMGYLLKGTPAKELTDAIRSIHRGYAQIGPGIYRNLALPQTEEAEKLPVISPSANQVKKTEVSLEKSYPPGELVSRKASKEDSALSKRDPAALNTRKFEQTVMLRPSPKWSRLTMGLSLIHI